MVCTQIIGNHTTISIAGSQWHFELNAYKPVIIYNLLQSINLLNDSILSFSTKCLKNIKVNKKIIDENLNNSLMLVTALSPKVGYDNAAKIAKKAYNEGLTLKEAAIKLKLINLKEFNKLINPKKMIK